MLRRSEYGIGFERGLSGGNEVEPVESQFFASRLGHEKVSEVNWVEGATVEPDFFHAGRLGHWRDWKR